VAPEPSSCGGQPMLDCGHGFTIRGIMTTHRPKLGARLAGRSKTLPAGKLPARHFPIEREIQNLENELNAFNDRMAELESEGHRGHAMEVLKANAMDFARRIDELRILLLECAPKEGSKGKS
jgi:hypothetical protein